VFKLLFFVLALLWVWWHQDLVTEWLWSVSGGEFLGFKFEKEVVDQASADLNAYANSNGYELDKALGEVAIRRAARVAPAVVGSRVLSGWMGIQTIIPPL
jgi:hypothetical protein